MTQVYASPKIVYKHYNKGMKRRTISTIKYQILQLYYDGASPTEICNEYHIAHSTFYKWRKDYPKESIDRTRVNGKNPVNITRLVSHLRKVEAELSFLHRTVAEKMPLRERMKIIDNEYGKESLKVQCEALSVNRSSYLNHKNRGKNEDAWFIKREAEYAEEICKIYRQSGQVYGAKKIAVIMRGEGKHISDEYVRRIMANAGLVSTRSAAYKNHLLVERSMRRAAHSSQIFQPNAINQVWVSDVTAVCIREHFYYICAYIDLFSRKVVGYNVGRNSSVQLVKQTFFNTFNNRNPKSLILHTDNGAIYTSYSFNMMLSKLKVAHSFSRPGVPHDNAVAETFFNTLKRESIFLDNYPKSYRELKERVDIYMNWYNSKRLHEHLHYVTPNEFEEKKNSSYINAIEVMKANI